MKRIVWVGVALLVMVAILGYGLHTLNRIDQVNRERREKEAGKVVASQIAIVPATTSIWDKLRQTDEAGAQPQPADPQPMDPQPVDPPQPGEELPDGQVPVEVPEEHVSPEAGQSPEQTITEADQPLVVVVP